MAKPTLANLVIQAAAIRDAVNSALSDTILTGTHPDWKDPAHPMRDFSKYIQMDDAGTYTVNTAYINNAYDDIKIPVGYADKSDRVTNPPS